MSWIKHQRGPQRHSSPPFRFVLAALLLAWNTAIWTGHGQDPLTRSLLTNSGVLSNRTNSPPGTPDTGALPETIEEKLGKVRAELAKLKNIENTKEAPQNSLKRGWLDRLMRLYEQQISYNSELLSLKKHRGELEEEAKSWTSFGPPPYSILLRDDLRESLQVERQEMARITSALATLRQLIEENRRALQNSEERIRQLNESLEKDADPASGGELAWRRELERVRSQTVAASIAVLDLERQIRQERLAASRIRVDLLERQLVAASPGVVFTEAEMQAVTSRLDDEQNLLDREVTAAEARRRDALKARDRINEEWSRTRAEARADSPDLATLQETVELRRVQLELADTALGVRHFLLQVGTAERIIWEARFAIFRSRDEEAIRLTERRLDELRRRVEIWHSYYMQQLEATSSQATLLETRLAGLEESSNLAPLVRERLAGLRERDQLLLRVVRSTERVDRLLQRLAEDLQNATENLPITGRVRNAFSNSKSLVGRLWSLELFAAQDTIIIDGQAITGKRSVTLGKIISVILIVVLGYWLTGRLARISQPFVVKHFKMDTNQANLIRRWLRAVLVFALAIGSLVWAKIPLTVFAFAGGALMIALGFGMQTLLKNLVSGIIILFERPFRVGDVLDFAGQQGTVISVGIRSSVLQLWDNTEMLIPNSALLENSVTNWTYSNRKVRFIVSVGVAYGADTRRVVQLLTEIVERHGLVEKDPPPQILLTNFGENALTFEIRFWTDVLKGSPSQISSDLRQMIAVAFAEQGIVIAFPQRDIRLDATKPLQIQVVPSAAEQPEETSETLLKRR